MGIPEFKWLRVPTTLWPRNFILRISESGPLFTDYRDIFKMNPKVNIMYGALFDCFWILYTQCSIILISLTKILSVLTGALNLPFFQIPYFGSPHVPTFLEHSPRALKAIRSARGNIRSQICNYEPRFQHRSGAWNGTDGASSSSPTSSPLVQKLDVPDILSDIVVNSNVHWEGWAYGIRRLIEIESCPAVFSYVRSFEFNIYATYPPPLWFASRLASLLERMARLEKLLIVIPEDFTDEFEVEFRKMGLNLPNVKSLIVSPFMEWMVDLCPHVKNIETSRWWHNSKRADYSLLREHSMRLIEAAAELRYLERLEIKEWWSIEALESQRQPSLTLSKTH